jgi:hypothetical protein
MSKNTTIVARVGRTERAGVSYYGNPAFTVALVTESGDISIHRTMSNAGISYAINNPEYREELHEWHLTPSGRIKFARKLSD